MAKLLDMLQVDLAKMFAFLESTFPDFFQRLWQSDLSQILAFRKRASFDLGVARGDYDLFDPLAPRKSLFEHFATAGRQSYDSADREKGGHDMHGGEWYENILSKMAKI